MIEIGPDHPRPGVSTRTAVLGIALLATVTLAACSSSSKPGGSSTSATSTAASTSAPATMSGSGANIGTAADAATTAAVKNAYAKLFASSTPEAESLSLLQDGPAFKDVIEAQAKSSLAQGASASVSSVVLQSPNLAKVVFTISINGSAVLPNNPGYAVREGGTWKVAGSTFCALLAAQGSPPPVCSAAAATTLPQ